MILLEELRIITKSNHTGAAVLGFVKNLNDYTDDIHNAAGRLAEYVKGCGMKRGWSMHLHEKITDYFTSM